MIASSIQDETLEWFRALTLQDDTILPSWAPPVDHCAGRNKFLGSLLGLYIVPVSRKSDLQLCKKINKLGVLTRAYIVVHDKWYDECPSVSESEVNKYLTNIKEHGLRMTTELLGSRARAERIWTSAEDHAKSSYEKLENGYAPEFDSITGKCWLESVPIETLSHFDADYPRQAIVDFFQIFLFLLQLLDDFCDMEEDYFYKTNHNLLVWGLERQVAERLIGTRSVWAKGLCKYVGGVLRQMSIVAESDPRFSQFRALFERSISFLENVCATKVGQELDGSGALWIAHGGIRDYRPPALEAEKLDHLLPAWQRDDAAYIGPTSIAKIRAETLHELSYSRQLENIIQGGLAK